MHFPEEIFREYDIRGIVGTHLTAAFAEHLGRAVGTWVKRGKGRTLVVGQDCRTHGSELVNALAKGAASTGCDVVGIGVVPTPVGYWAIQHLKADGGVQVTGSHNPPEYNGFKMTLLGKSLHGSDIQSLRQMIAKSDYEQGQGQIRQQEIVNAYIRELGQNLRPAQAPFKVVIDAGNGCGGITAVELYQQLGYEVVPTFCEPDGTFPNHHPDPTVEKNLEALKANVRKHQADIGIAFDGDADRIGVVDKDGTVIWGDRLMIVLSRALLQEVPGAAIIGEVKCSKTLYDDIRAKGGQGIMWRTGHSLIKSKMKELGAQLAGEMSGHIFYKHRFYGFDDAVYAGGRLLEILSTKKSSISELLKDVPATVSTPELRRDCPEAMKVKLVKKATEYFQQGSARGGYRVVDIDGARVEWSDGWGLVRCSNTQPILVLRFEAQTEKRLTEIRELFETTLNTLQKELE